jgi:ATP-binding cassette subfamily F protein 3
LLTGLLVAGLGGRLVMRAAALLEPSAIGRFTENGNQIGEIYAKLADADAYTVRPRAEQLLVGLGFRHEELEMPVLSFSGGWRMRLNLAQALMCPRPAAAR